MILIAILKLVIIGIIAFGVLMLLANLAISFSPRKLKLYIIERLQRSLDLQDANLNAPKDKYLCALCKVKWDSNMTVAVTGQRKCPSCGVPVILITDEVTV